MITMMMTMMMARWGYMSAVYHNTDTCWLRRTFGLAARPKINLCDDDVRTWERYKYLELILFDLYLRKTASWKILTWTGPKSPGVVLVQSSEEIIVQGALGPDWMELPRNVYSPLRPYHSDIWISDTRNIHKHSSKIGICAVSLYAISSWVRFGQFPLNWILPPSIDVPCMYILKYIHYVWEGRENVREIV